MKTKGSYFMYHTILKFRCISFISYLKTSKKTENIPLPVFGEY